MPRIISKTEVKQSVSSLSESTGNPDPSTEETKTLEEMASAAPPVFKLAWESRDRDRDGNYWSFACDSLGLLITLNRTLQSLNSDGNNPAGRPRRNAEWILLVFGKVIGRGALADLKENALKYLQNQT